MTNSIIKTALFASVLVLGFAGTSMAASTPGSTAYLQDRVTNQNTRTANGVNEGTVTQAGQDRQNGRDAIATHEINNGHDLAAAHELNKNSRHIYVGKHN